MRVYALNRVPFACDGDMMLPHAIYATRERAERAKQRLERRDRKGGWAPQDMEIKEMKVRGTR